MAAVFDIQKLRNIGVIAHIDAGKTTTTERILYYTGETHKMGDVDDGTTTTDSDPAEQERGITIKAAAVTCRWKDVRINIIDTPGHVDFTAEVERSLRVLDGAIVVFSGMEGVEAQSETVWRQAKHYSVPLICFINKLDRIGADFYRVLDEIGERLEAKTLCLQLPIGKEKEFAGCIDLVTEQAYYFDNQTLGKNVTVEPVPEEYRDETALWRERLIETLADLDDRLAERFLAGETITVEELKPIIRRATLEFGWHPIFCGSSLKYIGVQPLLDGVADYLPSPADLPPVKGRDEKGNEVSRRPLRDEPFTGLLFKVVADKHDELGFVRIYSGTLKPATRLLNATRNVKENVTRLWHIHGKRLDKVEEAEAGDIVGIVGLRNSITGDTLCDTKAPLVLEQITFPESVISMAIEPESSADRDKLTTVLRALEKEDPTFTARVSQETGETIICGMGELHLEIVTEKMRDNYNLKIRVGKPRVSYRETIRQSIRVTGECHRQTANGQLYAVVTIELEPLPRKAGGAGHVPFVYRDLCPAEAIPFEFRTVIGEALREECLSGGLAGYPLTDIQATLIDAKWREGESNDQAFRIAVSYAVREALNQAGVNILEPVMKVEITTPEEYLGDVTSDLAARRATIEAINLRGTTLRTVTSLSPLREMFGYSTKLRSLSQGRAGFSMEPYDYQIAPPEVTKSMF